MDLSERELSALRGLIDKQAIYENVLRYGRGLDRYDLEMIKSAYWPDATEDHGTFTGNSHEFAEFAYSRRNNVSNVCHYLANVHIELEGQQAKVETYFQNVLFCKLSGSEDSLEYVIGGRYRDLYEKRGDDWKILRRLCIFDWCSERPATSNWKRIGIKLDRNNSGTYWPNDPIYGDWTSIDSDDHFGKS